jgi:glycerate kinase
MKVLVAPDSFKGSLSSVAVAKALAAGVLEACPEAEVVQLPVGDGGEGSAEALVTSTNGRLKTVEVTGPTGRRIPARLGLLGDGRSVFVEMAEASGLSKVAPDPLQPLAATTFGTGELFRAALEEGCPRILMGIGGSATSDGGAGFLQALGARLRDGAGRDLGRGAAALAGLAAIDASSVSLPPGVELIVACDVTNPLTGEQGAARIFGPQKGVLPDQMAELDAALGHFADLVAATTGRDLREEPGAGAAGGLGFALLSFLPCRLRRGVELVMEEIEFESAFEGCDLVIGGEGRIDSQTIRHGKTLSGLGAAARRAGVPLFAIAGGLGSDLSQYRDKGITGVMSIVPRPMLLSEAMEADTARLLAQDAARRMMEVFLAGRAGALKA